MEYVEYGCVGIFFLFILVLFVNTLMGALGINYYPWEKR